MLNALQAQEQKRIMRQEDEIEGALFVKHREKGKNYKKNGSSQASSGDSRNFNRSNTGNKKRTFSFMPAL